MKYHIASNLIIDSIITYSQKFSFTAQLGLFIYLFNQKTHRGFMLIDITKHMIKNI